MEIYLIGVAAALCFAALGSVFGCGIASSAAVGAWKKCYMNGKQGPFTLVAFSGAPLTQTIYGYLLATFISSNMYVDGTFMKSKSYLAVFIGILGGIVIGMSAYFQGKAGAAGCDSLAETGKGTANYFIVVGIIETVALFTLIFGLLLMQA